MSSREPFKWRKGKTQAQPAAARKEEQAAARPSPSQSQPQPKAPDAGPKEPDRPSRESAPSREHLSVNMDVKAPKRAPASDSAAPASAPAKSQAPTHEQIAVLAYSIWESQGWPHGADRDHWHEAERRLSGGAR